MLSQWCRFAGRAVSSGPFLMNSMLSLLKTLWYGRHPLIAPTFKAFASSAFPRPGARIIVSVRIRVVFACAGHHNDTRTFERSTRSRCFGASMTSSRATGCDHGDPLSWHASLLRSSPRAQCSVLQVFRTNIIIL